MNRSLFNLPILAALAIAAAAAAPAGAADPGRLTIRVDQPGARISPMFYGLMTEEINYSYDGGLYGELIRNRIFKDNAETPVHWAADGMTDYVKLSLDASDPVNTTALTTALRVDVKPGDVQPSAWAAGVSNDGYWGIPVKPNTTYTASFYAKGGPGFTRPLYVSIRANAGNGERALAHAETARLTNQWQKYTVSLKSDADVTPSFDNRFTIRTDIPGTFYLNLVSLFPPTFHDRPNGNRVDIMQLLDDMHPAFLRFPGGNYVEGQNYENRWDWPRTRGPLEERPGHRSPWNYRATDGMGLLEYLEWCEDLKMEPVLAVFAAYTLNGRSYPDEYAKFAQEAVDEIEYVTGDTTTPWGARRAKDGHPAPFKLTYVEIGNEDPATGTRATYAQRFPVFYDAIKARYPNIQVISTTRNNFGPRTPDVIDEHYYMSFYSAQQNAHMYDNRPRTTPDGKPVPRIFVGEWATRDNRPTPTFQSALSDAAFLTGLERNADLIIMSCYAPLFVNVNRGGQQWATDLIGYDTLTAFGSPSYYVQKMFYNNRGDVVLPISALSPQTEPPPLTPPPGRRGGAPPATTSAGSAAGGRGPLPPPPIFASATRDNATGDIILKFVNPREIPQLMEISLQGAAGISRQASGWVLAGDPAAVNSIAQPTLVAPKPFTVDAGPTFTHEFPANSVTVLRLKTR